MRPVRRLLLAARGRPSRAGSIDYTRVLFTQPLKRQLIDCLGYGPALEGMSVVDRTVTPDT
jgi:hypothetical protein